MKHVVLIINLLISLALVIIAAGCVVTEKPLLGLSILFIAALSLPWEDKWRPKKLKSSTLKIIKSGIAIFLIVAGFSAIQSRKNLLEKQALESPQEAISEASIKLPLNPDSQTSLQKETKGLILVESGQAVHKMKSNLPLIKPKNSKITISTPAPMASDFKISQPKPLYLTPLQLPGDVKSTKKTTTPPTRSSQPIQKTQPIRLKHTPKPKVSVTIKSNPKAKPSHSSKPTAQSPPPIAVPSPQRLPLGAKSSWPALDKGLNQPIPVPTLTIPTLTRTSKEEMPPLPPIPSF